MISEKAKNFLHFLVDKYTETGETSFAFIDYISMKNHERLITELCNEYLLVKSERSIDGTITLTEEAINYKF